MAPKKKVPLKPPAAAVGGANVAARAERPRSPSPPPVSSSDVTIVQVKGAEPSDIFVAPAMMKRLGLRAGSIVQLQTQDAIGWFEVAAGNQVAGSNVGVCDQSAAILVQNRAELEPMRAAARAASLVTLSCRPIGDGNISTRADPEQLAALFRSKMQRRLVFKGMVVLVYAAAMSHYLEVVSCGGSDPFGVVVESTAITWGQEVELQPVERSIPLQSPPVVSTLLVGEPGTGKSFHLRQMGDVHAALGRRVEKVHLEALAHDGSSVTAATYLRRTFSQFSAGCDQPVTLVMDDLHMVCGAAAAESASSSKWAAMHVESVLRECLDEIQVQEDGGSVSHSPSSVVVLAAALPHKLSDRLKSRFAVVQELLPPSSGAERLLVLERCLAENRIELADTSSSERIKEVLKAVCNRAHGFNQRDLNSICVTATMLAFTQRQSLKISVDDILAASKQVRPSVLKGFEVSTAKVHWADIGGSEEAKTVLQDCVAWCLGRNREMFEKYKLSPPKGVLLYGPPGCSKTMLAKALATESNMNFIAVKGPEVFSKWVGDSEKAVREIFNKARLVMPCVVFIDELDGMCAHRGGGGVGDRVISQFLTELDGMPAALAASANSIVVVAATNRPDSIDPAVLRPGRIDRKVYVGLPEEGERVAIARIGLRNMPTADEVTAELVASRTAGYSGAEIISVCKEAAFHAIGEAINSERVEMRHLDAALKKVTPRITPMDVAWYLSWKGGRTANSAPFAAAASSLLGNAR